MNTIKILTDKEGHPILLPDGKVICVDDVVYFKDIQIGDTGTSIIGENGIGRIPIGNPVRPGLLMPAGASYGIAYQASGNISVAAATEAEINAKTNNYKPITPKNLEYAVHSVVDKKFELIETIEFDGTVNTILKTAEPNGTPYNFRHAIVQYDFPNGSWAAFTLYTRFYVEPGNALGGYQAVTAHNDYWKRFSTEGEIKDGRFTYLVRQLSISYGGLDGSNDQNFVLSNPKTFLTDKNIMIIQIQTSGIIPNGTVARIYAIRA